MLVIQGIPLAQHVAQVMCMGTVVVMVMMDGAVGLSAARVVMRVAVMLVVILHVATVIVTVVPALGHVVTTVAVIVETVGIVGTVAILIVEAVTAPSYDHVIVGDAIVETVGIVAILIVEAHMITL